MVDDNRLLIFILVSYALLILALFYLVGCSPTMDRFDTRPDLCRDLGKRGRDC